MRMKMGISWGVCLLAVLGVARAEQTAKEPPVVNSPVLSNAEGSKPNFVTIFTDDQGYADLSCFGADHVSTPRIDQMAAEGSRLTSFYVAAPLCTPSRAALMTGSYPKRLDMATGDGFPVLLAADKKGETTQSKEFLGEKSDFRGFDRYDVSTGKGTISVVCGLATFVLGVLTSNKQMKPFPLELTNQSDNPEYGAAMQQLRKAYDGHLAHWKAEAVPYNNYDRFGTLFDRDTPWSEKEGLIRKKRVKKSGADKSKTNKRQLKGADK